MDYQVKKDCFAYDKNLDMCIALKDLYCDFEKCNFYKPKSDFDNDQWWHTVYNIFE